MPFNEHDCPIIHMYLKWVYSGDRSLAELTPDQFALWWRSLSDDERQIEWDKCTLHPDFD